MVSLTQILLDSTARTLRGFRDLIVREWCVAGHPFFEAKPGAPANLVFIMVRFMWAIFVRFEISVLACEERSRVSLSRLFYI